MKNQRKNKKKKRSIRKNKKIKPTRTVGLDGRLDPGRPDPGRPLVCRPHGRQHCTSLSCTTPLFYTNEIQPSVVGLHFTFLLPSSFLHSLFLLFFSYFSFFLFSFYCIRNGIRCSQTHFQIETCCHTVMAKRWGFLPSNHKLTPQHFKKKAQI